MRAVITWVSSANVSADGEMVDELPHPSLLVPVGVDRDDDAATAKTLATKIWGLRVLRDELSAGDVNTSILAVSQFTLFASAQKDRYPGWPKAAPGPVSEPIVEALANEPKAFGATVERGRFDAGMQVTSVNDGLTITLIDTVVWE